MNDARERKLSEAIELLKNRKRQLRKVRSSVWDDYDHLPEEERFQDLQDHLSDAVDSLDETESLLDGVIEDLERALHRTIVVAGSDGKEEQITEEKRPDGESPTGNTDERPIVEVKQKDDRLGCGITLAILIGAFLFIPLGIFFIYCNEVILGVMMFVGFLLSIPMVIWVTKRTLSLSESDNNHPTNEHIQISPDTELMIGILGAEAIDRKVKSAMAESEKRRYDSLYWQESIRDKNPRHDFDYDHMDD